MNQEFPEQPPRSFPYIPQHTTLVEEQQNRAGQSTHSAREMLFLNQTQPTAATEAEKLQGKCWAENRQQNNPCSGKMKRNLPAFRWEQLPWESSSVFLQGAEPCQSSHLHLQPNCSLCSPRGTGKTSRTWNAPSEGLFPGGFIAMMVGVSTWTKTRDTKSARDTAGTQLSPARRNPPWPPTWPWDFCSPCQAPVEHHCSLP